MKWDGFNLKNQKNNGHHTLKGVVCDSPLFLGSAKAHPPTKVGGFRLTFADKKLIFIIILFLIFLTLLTNFSWSSDKEDYSDIGKFFAGKYSAKTRSSHSYVLGFIHAPLIKLTNSFIGFKITSLIFLLLIVYSVYLINGKCLKSLWLMLLSPIVWYMAPFTNPIQLASLIFLWAYYFLEKYDCGLKIRYLLLSGVLIGFGISIWDAVIFFSIFLLIVFFYDKKFSHVILFILFIILGLSPRLLLDQYLFGFPFYTLLKKIAGTITTLKGGIYLDSIGYTPKNFVNIILVFISIPLMYWKLYKPKNFIKQWKSIIFLSLCLLLIFMTPQMRYTLLIVPIMILLIGKGINEGQFKKQIIFSLVIIILFIFPYVVQINESGGNLVGGVEINYLLGNSFDFGFDGALSEEIIKNDLKEITKNYPNEIFVVGNDVDKYQILASLYWGTEVKEFVSIQDYNLFLENNDLLYEKKITFTPRISNRREIWIAGGMNKNSLDNTEYETINYGIGFGGPIEIEDFVVIKKYDNLYLSKKINKT